MRSNLNLQTSKDSTTLDLVTNWDFLTSIILLVVIHTSTTFYFPKEKETTQTQVFCCIFVYRLTLGIVW